MTVDTGCPEVDSADCTFAAIVLINNLTAFKKDLTVVPFPVKEDV